MKLPLLIVMLVGSLGQLTFAISLDDAIEDYLKRSPQLKAQTTLTELSGGDRWRRFVFHEPQFQLMNSDDSSATSYALSLTTAFPGKSIAYSEFDRAKSQSDQLELLARKHDISRLVAQAYLDCASSHALVVIQREAVEDFETLAKSLRILYNSGHSTQAEKIGADLQLRQTTADLETALSHSEGLCKRWRDIYGDPNAVPDSIPDDLKPETVSRLGNKTADQERATGQIGVAQANHDLNWWAQAPDISWSVARNHYTYEPASPSGKVWTTTYGVAITIPIFFLFGESVEAKRSAAQSLMDRNTAEIQLLSANADQEDAAKEFARNQRRLKELRESDIPLAEALVDSTYASYKIGKLGYAELILSRKTLLDLKTQEIQTRISSVGARLRCLDSCVDMKASGRSNQ